MLSQNFKFLWKFGVLTDEKLTYTLVDYFYTKRNIRNSGNEWKFCKIISKFQLKAKRQCGLRCEQRAEK